MQERREAISDRLDSALPFIFQGSHEELYFVDVNCPYVLTAKVRPEMDIHCGTVVEEGPRGNLRLDLGKIVGQELVAGVRVLLGGR